MTIIFAHQLKFPQEYIDCEQYPCYWPTEPEADSIPTAHVGDEIRKGFLSIKILSYIYLKFPL